MNNLTRFEAFYCGRFRFERFQSIMKLYTIMSFDFQID